MFGSKKFNSLKNQGEIIFKSPFLKNLSALERYEFLQLCHRRQYKESEFIYYEGDPGTGMYFIEKGKVQLKIEPEIDSDGEASSFNLENGDSFGALSIGYELRRMSSAQCLTDSTLLGFFKPDFETLKKRHPSIAVKFMETLAMIAMKQLETTTGVLAKVQGKKQAYSLQFQAYLNSDIDVD